mgnify:CR=1 FL=1
MAKTQTVKEELLEASGIKGPKKNEKPATFARRVAQAVSDEIEEEGDDVFDDLSEDAQEWYSDAVKAIKRKRAVPAFPGDEDEDEEEAPAPKKKASKKKPEPEPEEDDDEDEDEEEAPAPKKKKASKKKPEPEPEEDDEDDDEDEDDDDEEEEAPAPKKPSKPANLKSRGGGKIFRRYYIKQVMKHGFDDVDIDTGVEEVIEAGYAFTEASATVAIYEARNVLELMGKEGIIDIPGFSEA